MEGQSAPRPPLNMNKKSGKREYKTEKKKKLSKEREKPDRFFYLAHTDR